ncbi:MAG: hypothetical protein J0L88_09060 [Xanthomonadales bacterium]|nr:hypothetical protein [Xanthomonadales bacterium]
MQTLGIHDIGLPVDASRALHSMLQVLNGRLRTPWQTCHLDRADVLIAHAASDPAVLASWSRGGKPLVLVIDERAPRPTSPFVLRQPIRVMQLMTMLESVAEQLASRPSAVQPRRARNPDSTWMPLESLRQLMARHGDAGPLVATTSDGCGVWIDRGTAYAAVSTLQRLRLGELRVGAFATGPQPVPASAVAFSTFDLAWFVALKGPTELAPWLERGTAYRLRRWPDFGRLGGTSALIELAALASAHAWTPARLAEASCQPIEDVHRFLNAASMAGLVVNAPVTAQPRAAAAATSMWSRFVGDLRRHLGRVA